MKRPAIMLVFVALAASACGSSGAVGEGADQRRRQHAAPLSDGGSTHSDPDRAR